VSLFSPNARRPSRRVKYAAVTLALVVVCFYTSVLPVLRSALRTYLGVSLAKYGAMFGAGMLIGIAGAVLGGSLVDRWRPRRVIRLCLLGVAVSFALIGLAGRRWVLIAFALGIKAFFVRPLHIAVSAYLIRLFPQRRRRLLSLNLLSQSIAGLLFPLGAEGLLWLSVGAGLLSFAAVLHGPFLVLALVLAGGSLLYRRRAAVGGAAPTQTRWAWRDLLVPRRALAPMALMTLHAAGDSTLYLWMPYYLERGGFADRPFPPGVVLSAYAVAYLLSRALLAGIRENWGTRGLLVLPGILGGGALIAGLLSRDYTLTAVGYVVGAFFWSVEYPAVWSALSALAPDRFGAAMAWHLTANDLVVAAGVILVGALTTVWGEAQMWRVMLLPAALFPLFGLAAFVWLCARARPTAHE